MTISLISFAHAETNVDEAMVNNQVKNLKVKYNQVKYSFDGLKLVEAGDFDAVYVKPNVNFKIFDKIMLIPGEVSFKQNWALEHRSEVSQVEISSIRHHLSDLISESFKISLSKQSKFQVVNDAGLGVLLLKPSIIKLDVHSPGVESADKIRKFIKSAGEASLYLEVYDSVSGAILARIIDRQIDNESEFFMWPSRETNTADAKKMINQWTTSFNELLSRAQN
jgi:hypothetical protein